MKAYFFYAALAVGVVSALIWFGMLVIRTNEEHQRCPTACEPYLSRKIDGQCHCMDADKRWVPRTEVEHDGS